MPSFIDLPAELRQRILALIPLPDVNYIGKPWPRSVLDLLQVNQLIRRDMQCILNFWSPVHSVPNASHLATLTVQTITIEGKPYSPKLSRLCLDLFHDSDVNRIRWVCYCVGLEHWCHPEIMQAWLDAVALLPEDVSAIFLDVTPAPGYMRSKPRYIINPFIHHRSTAQKFLGEHVVDVFQLIRAIHRKYHDNVPIRLVGKLSRRSENRFLFNVIRHCAEAGIDVSFDGQWITTKEAYVAKISKAVEMIAPAQKARQAKLRGEAFLLEPLRQVEWSEKTKHLYAEVYDNGNTGAGMENLRLLAEFLVDRSRSVLSTTPTGNTQRALIHNVAQDMGFNTTSKGEGQNQYVVATKAKAEKKRY